MRASSNDTTRTALAQALALIEQRTGLAAGTHLRRDLQSVITQMAGEDIDAYLQRLRQREETAPEWQTLINALTIGETYFMRNKSHFKLLEEVILPDVLQRLQATPRRVIRVLSAGCATGEEPYSLAIFLQDWLAQRPGWQVDILGVDINAYALEVARKGIYRPWSFRHTHEQFRQRHFDIDADGALLKAPYRESVRFRRENIIKMPLVERFDLIFCRNVMLYFSKEQTQHSENRLYDLTEAGGWLVLGQAEALRSPRDNWITHIFPGAPIYQRPLDGYTLDPGAVRYEDGPHLVDSTLDAMPDAQRRPAYQAAVDAIHLDHLQEAERFLCDMLAEQPYHARAHALLAFIFANRHAYPEARAHLDAALRTEPLLADAHYVRAMMAIEAEQAENARNALQAALYCQKDHALAAFTMGTFHAQNGQLPRAYRAWELARRAVEPLADEDYVSDLSDLTARQFRQLLKDLLEAAE